MRIQTPASTLARTWTGLPLLSALYGCAVLLLACATSPTDTVGAQGEQREAEAPPSISVLAGVDLGSATVGDRIRLTIEVEYDAGLEVAALVYSSTLGDLEVVESGRTILREVRGRGALVEWVVLRAGAVGSYIVPPLEVSGRTANGSQHSASSDQVFVEILTVLPEGGVEDIRGLKPLEQDQSVFLWVVAGIGLFAVLMFWRWWRSRRERQNASSLAAHELAFRDLEALRSVNFSDLKQLRGYYFSLSAILRRYVEDRFGLNATDLTSEEIAGRLAVNGPMSPDQGATLVAFLGATDNVKYAAEVPRQQQIEEVYESALGFVEDTVPQQEEPSPDPPSDVVIPEDGGTSVNRRVASLTLGDRSKEGDPENRLHGFEDPISEVSDDERFMPR